MKKKFITGLLVAALSLGIVACASQGGAGTATGSGSGETAPAVDPTPIEFKTMDDVFAVENTEFSSTFDDTTYRCALCTGGRYYTVSCDLEEGMRADLEKAFFEDEKKLHDLLGPLPVKEQKEFTPPAQSELDALVGKTGKELKEQGYDLSNFAVNDTVTDVSCVNGDFTYLISFDGAVDEYAEDPVAEFDNLKVSGVALQGMSYTVLEDKA